MENATIVNLNQHLRLAPKGGSMFTVLRRPSLRFIDIICRSVALEQLLRNRTMGV